MRNSPQVRTLLLAFCAACAPPSAWAQTIQGVHPARVQLEAVGGYSLLSSTLVTSGTRINLNGVSGAAVFILTRQIDIVAEAGYYHQGNVAQSGDSLSVSSFEFGPRLKSPDFKHASIFIQGLFWVGHAGGTLYTNSLGPGLAPLGANNSPVLSAGGGADWNLNSAVRIRLIQAEYVHSSFLNGSSGANRNRQDSVRLGAGIVFRFGYYR